MTMTPEILEALQGSITKWTQIVNGAAVDEGPDNCPLCQMFNPNVFPDNPGCKACPVYPHTDGYGGCLNTPYVDFEDYTTSTNLDDVLLDATDPDHAEAIKLAQAELDFLKSLLPGDVK